MMAASVEAVVIGSTLVVEDLLNASYALVTRETCQQRVEQNRLYRPSGHPWLITGAASAPQLVEAVPLESVDVGLFAGDQARKRRRG